MAEETRIRDIRELINSGILAKELLSEKYIKDFKFYYKFHYDEEFIKKNKASIIWHYTKTDVLEKIFPPKNIIKYKNGERYEIENEEYCKDKIKLRFTNIRFLNDPSEGLVLREFYENNENLILNSLPENDRKKIPKEIFKEKMPDLYDSYVFSATHLENSFTFWNKEYAGANGIAIGINRRNFDLNSRIFAGDFLDVNYIDLHKKNGEEIIENISSIIKNINSFAELFSPLDNNEFNSCCLYLNMFSILFKHYSWKGEEEMRFPLIKGKKLSTDIEFSKNRITKNHYEYVNKNAVAHIMLGPECSEEQVEIVRDYLRINEYITSDNDIIVSKSSAFDLRYKSKQKT